MNSKGLFKERIKSPHLLYCRFLPSLIVDHFYLCLGAVSQGTDHIDEVPSVKLVSRSHMDQLFRKKSPQNAEQIMCCSQNSPCGC